MRKVRVHELLSRSKEPVELLDDRDYARVTIKVNHKGVVLRDVEKGSRIGTKKQFMIRSGQFLLSKIDARNGAFGIVPSELDGAVITGNFWTFAVNCDLVNINWFNLFTSSKPFLYICDVSSTGTTNRKYLDEGKFLNFELFLPDKAVQNDVVDRYCQQSAINDQLEQELIVQQALLAELRQNALANAVKDILC